MPGSQIDREVNARCTADGKRRQVPAIARPLLALALLCGFSGSAWAAMSSPAGMTPAVATVELRDQHGEPHTVAAARGEVAVVMVVAADRLRNLRGWQKALMERFEGLRYVLIADVPSDPPVTWEQVAEKLVRRVPDEVPVLIDVERRWSTELELDTERPNLLLFDRQGRLVERFRGREGEPLVTEVSRALERLTRP